MKIFRYCLLVFLLSLTAVAQEVKKDSIALETDAEESDTILGLPIELEEVVIYKDKFDAESMKQFLLLQRRVYVVYPYAKIASDRLTALNRNMDKMKSTKEKKKYFKLVENYIEDEFTARLKKLSRKQGQILVKLIHRQTGTTTFDLIKDYKSGWKAFWASNTAKVFDINLKAGYAPYDVNEDYLIETILVRAFKNGRLLKQEPAHPVDYEKLDAYWQERVAQLKQKKSIP
jgi:hypothetical protein